MLLTTLLVLAGTGFAGADHPNPDCTDPHREEFAAHPVKTAYYLYVPEDPQDESQMDKFGWWEDTNGRKGLQTEECRLSTGALIYKADRPHGRILV